MTVYVVPEDEYVKLTKRDHETAVDAFQVMNESIGRSLREKRLGLGLTQAQVAGKAKVRLETVCRIEKGRANPTLDTITRIAKALGIRM